MSVSIVCLIYKSIKYLEFVKKSIEEHTKTEDYDELLFILNDPTDELIDYVHKKEGLNWLINDNPDPEAYYMTRVYMGWNFAVEHAKGDIVVMVNSDMAFSKDWLPNLLKCLQKDNAMSSRLVESGKMPSGLHAISVNCGRSSEDFDKERFEKLAEVVKEDKRVLRGLYSPIAVYKETFFKLGGYPNGNLIINKQEIPGDVIFWTVASTKDVKHYTVFNSIVYHIQEGEKDEV